MKIMFAVYMVYLILSYWSTVGEHIYKSKDDRNETLWKLCANFASWFYASYYFTFFMLFPLAYSLLFDGFKQKINKNCVRAIL